jgi:uncharacterized protein YlxW (UPF0749 family)
MILIPAWLFTLFGAFTELVGREATAAIHRKKAADARKAREKKKVAKEIERARKAAGKRDAETADLIKRLAKSKRVRAALARRIDSMRVDVDDDPY